MYQFDTTYMYSITVALIVGLYQKRHPDFSVNPILVFAFIGCCVFLTVVSIFYSDDAFWITFLVLYVLYCCF